MQLTKYIIVVLFALFLSSSSSFADGTTRCADLVAAHGSAIVFCEDFENPSFNIPTTNMNASANTWKDTYGLSTGENGPGNCEGPAGNCVLDIVKSGECNASGETNCVGDGLQSLGLKHVRANTGGGAGTSPPFTGPAGGVTTFGITALMRWSPNFLGPHEAGTDYTGFGGACIENGGIGNTGAKFDFFYGPNVRMSNFWGGTGGAIWNVPTAPFGGQCPAYPNVNGNVGNNYPFMSVYLNHKITAERPNGVCPTADVAPWDNCDLHNAVFTVGSLCQDSTHLFGVPDPVLYDWRSPGESPPTTIGPGEWTCFQMHWTNMTSSSARYRQWVNNVKILDVSGIDTDHFPDTGVKSIQFDNFQNSCYGGLTTAYRYQDDMVVINASEPVPCSELGFSAGPTPTPTVSPTATATPATTPTPTPTATASPTTPPTGQGNPKADYLNFDGSNDRVIIPHNFRGPPSELETITDAITIEAWIRPETLSATTQQNRIVSRSSVLELTASTGDTGCGFGTSGHVQWRASIQGVNDRICGGSLSLNTWAHVAGVYTGSAFTLYINGTQVASAARSGTLDFNVSQLTMGNHPTSARPFDGDIDEVRIWNIARTQGQIAASMNSQLNGTESGLVAEYRLDDCVGQMVTNSTVNNLNGYLGAFNTSDSDDPTWVPGGCATPTPTSTPTATNTPTNSPTNTPTNTPTSTPTATPTIAPGSTPTATPTAAPGDGSGVLSYKPGSPAVVIIGGN